MKENKKTLPSFIVIIGITAIIVGIILFLNNTKGVTNDIEAIDRYDRKLAEEIIKSNANRDYALLFGTILRDTNLSPFEARSILEEHGCSKDREPPYSFDSSYFNYIFWTVGKVIDGIDEKNLKNLIPNKYNFVKSSSFEDALIKINLDEDKEKEIVLFIHTGIYETEFFYPVMLFVLDFDAETGNWEIAYIYSFPVKNINNWGVKADSYKITDLDGNGIEELHLRTGSMYPSSPYSRFSVHVITLKENEVIDLMPSNSSNFFESTFYDRDNDIYYLASWLWDAWADEDLKEGQHEAHFDCHYYGIDKYIFKDKEFILLEKLKTLKKYQLLQGDCESFLGIENILEKEKYAKMDIEK